MPRTTNLTIGEVSRLLGVPVPTLRSWHLRYGVAVPARSTGGHRRYSPADVAVLQALNGAVARGIAPRTAAQALRDGGGPDPHAPVGLLAELLDSAQAGDQPELARTLDRAEAALGLEGAVDRVLVPGLREIGRRWEVQLVDVGVEHLATAATRAWIAGRAALADVRSDEPPVLLAAAPGNRHTVALEAFGLLLRCKGWPTRETGADTPVPALLTAVERTGARAVVVSAHQATRRRGAVQGLHALRERGPLRLFFAGGAFDSPRHRAGVPGQYLGTDLPAAAGVVDASLQPSGAEPLRTNAQ